MENTTPRLILGLDISTTCIGMSLVLDEGICDMPKLLKMRYVAPKTKAKGIESLFIKRDLFEEFFTLEFSEYPITDVVIEEPLISSNNANTVATLIGFNRLIADSIYRRIHVIPSFISSYDARMFSFPELMSVRKYNKNGTPYTLKHVANDIRNKKIVLFGAYPFDIDKKTVMMDMVNKVYNDIEWLPGKKTQLRKENYDMCDSLVCALAYVNINHNGIEAPKMENVEYTDSNGERTYTYTIRIWDRKYDKKLITKIEPQ